ncbi:MAG: hypothetical protein MR598_04750, partial [Erysipelotrichaceae bacterium]|nr:hypothetical protein [Erysipelotrichaceae bacterium]
MITGMIVIFFFVLAFTYAVKSKGISNIMLSNILRIDEEAYGDTSFDSSHLNLVPISDEDVDFREKSVIDIEFFVGGNEENNKDNIVYDIALVDLNIDCTLLSPYVKWKLVKNDQILATG